MLLAGLALVLAICLYLYLDTIKPKKFPPGPRWLPFIGCAYVVCKLRERTGYLYKAVNQLSTECKDGSLLGLRIGEERIVIVNSIEANKEMLMNKNIDGRPKKLFFQTGTSTERRGLLLTDGELWQKQKQFLIKHLRGFGNARRGIENIARAEAYHMINDVMEIMDSHKNNGKSTEMFMHNFFNAYILNTLWKMMAGIRYNPSETKMVFLQSQLFELFAAVDMLGAVFRHCSILASWAPKQSNYNQFLRSHKKIWGLLSQEISRHYKPSKPVQKDKYFMDVYLRAFKKHKTFNTYSEEQLVATCMDLLMAGTETTSNSMSFCFSYLVREQEIQKKAQEEIDRVIGKKRCPYLDDMTNMPYMEAIVHECIRHFMGRAFGVPHRALRNTNLAGYIIPEDTMVVSNFTKILMDEKLFPEPYEFKPERFLSNGRVIIPDHYFPFGLAEHRCMGDVTAKCNIFVFTCVMLQRFSFLPVPGESLPSLIHIDGLFPSAAPFKALVVPRI